MTFINKYENVEPLSAWGKMEACATISSICDKEPFSWCDSVNALAFNCLGNSPVYLKPDLEYGIVTFDMDLNILITEYNQTEIWSYCQFCQAFKFKYCNLATAATDGHIKDPLSWNVGESIHFYTQSVIGCWGSSELWETPLRTAAEIRKDLVRISNGEISAVDAIENKESFRHEAISDLFSRLHDD